MRKEFAVTELNTVDDVKFLQFDAFGSNLLVSDGQSISIHVGKQWTDKSASVVID